MESIEKYQNCKIENLQDVYGGKYSIQTGDKGTPSQDKEVYNEDGCLIKGITGAGFSNWIHGNRSVTTYDGNCISSVYQPNESTPID